MAIADVASAHHTMHDLHCCFSVEVKLRESPGINTKVLNYSNLLTPEGGPWERVRVVIACHEGARIARTALNHDGGMEVTLCEAQGKLSVLHESALASCVTLAICRQEGHKGTPLLHAEGWEYTFEKRDMDG